MRRWIGPLAVALVLALGAYQLTLVQFPRVLMGLAIGRLSKAGVNSLYAAPLATDTSRAIVRPSPDLAYSSCPFDLSKGPVLVDAEPAPSSYWSLSVFDARTDVAFVRNNRQAAGKPIRITIARPEQQVPAGVEPVRVDGTHGIALIRILVNDRNRFAPIDTARRQSLCRPLSPSS